jgi:hypothetical protein
MTDYSRMSYEQLRSIADNDAIAEQMSEEEYEALSVQMWRKFGIEQGIREHPESPTSSSRRLPALRSILNRLRSNPTSETQPTLAPDASASPGQLRGAFKSGD